MATRAARTNNSEAEIMSRILKPDRATLSPAAARSILKLDFTAEDKDRMHQLAAKAREGTLTPAEKSEIENYEVVGTLISIMQSKARRSLKKSSTGRS